MRIRAAAKALGVFSKSSAIQKSRWTLEKKAETKGQQQQKCPWGADLESMKESTSQQGSHVPELRTVFPLWLMPLDLG